MRDMDIQADYFSKFVAATATATARWQALVLRVDPNDHSAWTKAHVAEEASSGKKVLEAFWALAGRPASKRPAMHRACRVKRPSLPSKYVLAIAGSGRNPDSSVSGNSSGLFWPRACGCTSPAAGAAPYLSPVYPVIRYRRIIEQELRMEYPVLRFQLLYLSWISQARCSERRKRQAVNRNRTARQER